ncbi:Tyrosine-protein phosphatase non-receptor type 11 [Trichinella pseudospiralis]|uniref:Tyrosine-protein phosphatase non-receptor type 11 n=1 Tax=Trichinella pseudospiralis TaxID=6337 RepID=A0A0V1DXX0_TRIPS|nr:Tyrosine-protein phosphatase non-receptor type 11 [Trichinella pseudospiralis]
MPVGVCQLHTVFTLQINSLHALISSQLILLLHLQKIVNDEAESRIVYHYQFLAWPDHGVPPNPGLQCTIDIRRTVQMLRSQRSGMVQTEAQYKFVYMSVHYYIDTFAKLLHEHKRIEDSGHEYTNIRYSAEVASNQVIPISPSPFGSSIRPCNHPQCEACSSTPVVYPPQLIPPPRPKKGPRNPRPENS